MMSKLCPVCNGLSMMQAVCSQCGSHAADLGRYSDMFGPYSPYREIEDMKMTDGYPDHANLQCIHLVQCPSCHHTFLLSVDEW